LEEETPRGFWGFKFFKGICFKLCSLKEFVLKGKSIAEKRDDSERQKNFKLKETTGLKLRHGASCA
jgi:hypothetical protein